MNITPGMFSSAKHDWETPPSVSDRGGDGMMLLELFSGTKSIARTFAASGWDVFTVDSDATTDPDLCADIMDLNAPDLLVAFGGRPDVVWASPPCTCFSVASIGRHWEGDSKRKRPKTKAAEDAVALVERTVHLIQGLRPTYYFIENPRGILRTLDVMRDLPRYTVTYCQYGDTRMKPTDIWTNMPLPGFAPPCRYGDPCHDPAPRGTKQGTQGLKGARERGVIPPALCAHVLVRCEEALREEMSA